LSLGSAFLVFLREETVFLIGLFYFFGTLGAVSTGYFLSAVEPRVYLVVGAGSFLTLYFLGALGLAGVSFFGVSFFSY